MAKIFAETAIQAALEPGLSDVDATFVQYEPMFDNPFCGFDPQAVGRRERVVLFGWFPTGTVEQYEEFTSLLSSSPNVTYVQLPQTIAQLRALAQSIKLE